MSWLYSILKKYKKHFYIYNFVPSTAKLSTFSKSPLINLFNNLDLNTKNIYPLHKTLDKKDDINYKLIGNFISYPESFINNRTLSDWKFYLKKLIKNELKNNLVYSLAILGYSKKNSSYITYGPHILVTNKIVFRKLVTYIEGQIDTIVFDLESGHVDEERIIFFKYRAISINKKIYNSVSKIDYNIDLSNETEKDLINSTHYKKILSLLKKIPLSKNFNDYGILLSNNFKNDENIYGYLYQYKYNINIFIYDINSFSYKCIVYKKGLEYFKFTDIINISNEVNLEYNDIITKYFQSNEIDFVRIINNNFIIIKDNNIIFIDTILNSKLIQRKEKNIKQNIKIGTFDIECFEDENNKFIPYSFKWKINDINKSYYLTDFKDYDEMLNICFSDIFQNCIGYTLYAHNLSSFDGLFIIKTLYRLFDVKPIFKDNKIMTFEISKTIMLNDKKRVLKFTLRCSLKMLPLKLDKLIKSFDINIPKLPFPYSFVNKYNLNYNGSLPEFKYYEDVLNYDDYLKLSKKYEKKSFNLKNETIKYLNNDVNSLYDIIFKFGKEFFDLENIDITKSISISSLALNTFLTNYYNDNKTPIYIPQYKQYKDIREAYFGGRVEVFGCYIENAHWYDVNSLYPYAMLMDMPTGKIIKSTDKNLNNYFGFCYASVDVPINIKKPPLPFRFGGLLYYPVGKWSGWFSSELLKYARDNYNINIIVHYGYKYNKTPNLFKDFIERYYNLKLKSDLENNEGKKQIAKLMLNSLYGRFGLKYISSITEILPSNQIKEISLKYQVVENEVFDVERGLEYIKYNIVPNDYLSEYDNGFYSDIKMKGEKNSNNIIRSVGIAAMVTANAMIYMDKFLNLPDNNCYYSDTDSGFFEKLLDEKYVGNNIGQFKYLGLVKRGYFISPKLYCLVMDDGRTIIKSKGLPSKNLTEQDFIELLNGKSKNFTLKRFKKDFKSFNIYHKNSEYNISPNMTKRNPIYNDKKNMIIDSFPIYVKDGVLHKFTKKFTQKELDNLRKEIMESNKILNPLIKRK
jgi:DNA polymerase type B, organellar and viral